MCWMVTLLAWPVRKHIRFKSPRNVHTFSFLLPLEFTAVLVPEWISGIPDLTWASLPTVFSTLPVGFQEHRWRSRHMSLTSMIFQRLLFEQWKWKRKDKNKISIEYIVSKCYLSYLLDSRWSYQGKASKWKSAPIERSQWFLCLSVQNF